MDFDQSRPHALHFVDAECALGTYELPTVFDGSPNSLLKKMDELGIAEACVSSAFALEYIIEEGNRQLSEVIKSFPRLHPVWTVAAHHMGEFPHPSVLRNQLKENNVRQVKLILHAAEGYLDALDVHLYGELLDMLAAERVPMQLDYHAFSQADTRDLRELVSGWPQLPVIITIPKQDETERALYYLWEKFDNLHLALSGYHLLGGIEMIVKRFGANVLLYSSHFPYFTPLQSMIQLIYSEISDEDKLKIAGKNMLGLMRNAFTAAEERQ